MSRSERRRNDFTEEQAIALGESGVWKNWTAREITEFQLIQERLCMPFSVFHRSITEVLGRDVYTHEFGLNYDGLYDEVFKGAPPPTFKQIVNLIPEEQRMVIFKRKRG